MNTEKMTKFLDLVTRRQSARKYLPDVVEPRKIENCLEAARLSPSASNSQPWSFIVVDDPVLKDQVAECTFDRVLTFNRFVKTAPVLVVFVLEKPKIVTRIGATFRKLEYPLIDIGIAAAHFCLQATEEGLGTCMLGWFNGNPIKKILNIPRSKSIGLIISVGYVPDDYKLREKSRKKFEEVVFFNAYSKVNGRR
jgi:nitroreductase